MGLSVRDRARSLAAEFGWEESFVLATLRAIRDLDKAISHLRSAGLVTEASEIERVRNRVHEGDF